MSFNGISHNVRPDQHSDLWGIDALEMHLGETGSLQVRPRRSGDPASIHEVVPQTLQHMLEEVGPGGRSWDHVLQKVEGATLEPNTGCITAAGMKKYFS